MRQLSSLCFGIQRNSFDLPYRKTIVIQHICARTLHAGVEFHVGSYCSAIYIYAKQNANFYGTPLVFHFARVYLYRHVSTRSAQIEENWLA